MPDDTAFEDETTHNPKWDSKFRQTMIRQEARTERMKTRWQSRNMTDVIVGASIVSVIFSVVVLFAIIVIDGPSDAEIIDGCIKRIDTDDRLPADQYAARVQACELIPK